MRFRALSLVAGVAVLALTAGGALAAGSLDLSNPPGSGFYSDSSYLAQTFTADKTGLLSEVDLWMGYSYNPTGSHSVTVYIQTTDPSTGAPTGGQPPASPLTSAVGLVPADAAGAWVPFVFPTPIGIASGTTYAIVFVTDRPNAIYYAGTYAGGKTWSYDGSWMGHDSEYAFQTFVAATAPPTVAMAFGAASIPVGGTTSLTYTITNPNAALPAVMPALLVSSTLTNIGFTDTLPAGLLIATPNNIGGGCGGAITATAGTNLVSITGLTLAAGATCGFGVNVIGTTAGTKNNTTAAITATEAGPGNSASASIVVAAPATPTPAPTAAPTATPTAAPTATPTAAPTATRTAAPTATPPTTSTVDHRGPGSEAPLLLFLALTAIAGLLLTGLLLRPESRVRRR